MQPRKIIDTMTQIERTGSLCRHRNRQIVTSPPQRYKPTLFCYLAAPSRLLLGLGRGRGTAASAEAGARHRVGVVVVVLRLASSILQRLHIV